MATKDDLILQSHVCSAVGSSPDEVDHTSSATLRCVLERDELNALACEAWARPLPCPWDAVAWHFSVLVISAAGSLGCSKLPVRAAACVHFTRAARA